MDTLKEWALYYASIGLPVFPLIQNKKVPAVTKGFHSATTDTATIERWWTGHPNCNIGVATGNGLVCIDLDCKNDGEDGAETLRLWEREHGELPDTWRCITPSGSTHIYYRTAENIGVVNHGPVFPDIDIHGSGAYMVLPPSRVIWNDKPCEYLWECGFSPEETQLTEADSVVTEFLHSAFKRVETSTQEGISEKHQKTIMPDVIKAGERHSQLVSLAGALRAKNLSEKAILEALTAENDEKCEDPKMSDKDIQKLVKWVMTKDTSEAQMEAERAAKEEAQKEGTAEVSSALTSLDSIEEKEVEWLVTNKIPRGQLTMLVGSGGSGKTFIWVDLAAAISAGRTCLLDPEIPFDEEDNPVGRKPAKVMFFSSEDSVASVLIPRLKACNANMSNIFTIPLEDARFKKIKFDSKELEALLAEYRPELCVFDPVQGFLPRGVKMSERNEMREAVETLIGYGEKYNVTFVLVIHTNKRPGASGRERMADTADLWDIARSVLIVGDTEDENGNRYRYISHEKSNYGREERTTIFDITDSHVEYKGTCDKKDDDFVKAKMYRQRSKPAQEDASAAIMNMLLGGPMASDDLDSILLASGMSKATIKRAKTDLNKSKEIKFTPCGYGKAKRTYISFPDITKEEIQEIYNEDVKNAHKENGS